MIFIMNTMFYLWLSFINILDTHNGAITAAATIVIAIFTIVLAISTKKLWKETRDTGRTAKQAAEAATKSAKIAEVALIVSERAYVSVINCSRIEERTYPTFDLRFKNNGHTPAFNLIPSMKVYLDEWPLKTILPPHSGNAAKSTLGPNCDSGMIASWTERIISPEQDERLNSGKYALYIYGRFDYCDAFETKRFTEYRFAYRLANTGKILITPEPEGNESN